MKSWKRWIKWASLYCGTLLFLYFSITVLTPTLGTIVGYADQQPVLQVIQHANSSPPESVDKIRRLAKVYFDKNPNHQKDHWPEPITIEEKSDCWLVRFGAKTPIYSFCGVKQTFPPPAPAMFISIDKSNLGVRFGPWCQ